MKESSMEYALKLENVTKEYKDFKLDNISVNVPRGVIMGFIGENGAGKSTTIKLILDLIRRDAGIITVLGTDVCELKSIKEKIGVVMDESCFPENLNVEEISKIMKRIYSTWNDERFFGYMEKFSIAARKPVKEYSRGMKMKLSIAAALSHDSEILIMDEATSGLDPIVREEILDIFLDFIQDETHSIFMSSHIISDLEKICDYITFIHKGRIIFSESKDVLIDNYGILKCSEEELKEVLPEAIKGIRKNKFGIEALVLKNEISVRHVVDRANIEDIMLFYVKENAL